MSVKERQEPVVVRALKRQKEITILMWGGSSYQGFVEYNRSSFWHLFVWRMCKGDMLDVEKIAQKDIPHKLKVSIRSIAVTELNTEAAKRGV